MVTKTRTRPDTHLVTQYTTGYELGTGLRVTLAPGEYLITGQDTQDGRLSLRLQDMYRIEIHPDQD